MKVFTNLTFDIESVPELVHPKVGIFLGEGVELNEDIIRSIIDSMNLADEILR